MTDHSKWKFNHTMLRIKDPKKSVDYYKLLGLTLVNQIQFPEAKFDLYFLGKSPNTWILKTNLILKFPLSL